MRIPSYWAEATSRHHCGQKQLTLHRWGWSENSQEQAQLHAQERVAQAMVEALQVWPGGGGFLRRERKVPYNGADGVPIREEVLEERLEGVITRNSYGARCLNVDDVLFVDVDNDILLRMPHGAVRVVTRVALAVALAWIGASWLLPAHSMAPFPGSAWLVAFKCLFVGFTATWLLGCWTWRTAHRWLVAKRGLALGAARRALRDEIAMNPLGCWRVYQTPNGARIMALHSVFDPASQATQDLMRRLCVDPLYAAMCRRQHCFRARVSPKPWRVPGATRLRGPVWPVAGEALLRRQQWAQGYEPLGRHFAACRFIEQFGAGEPCPKAHSVRQWHDQLSQACSNKPLA